MRYVLYWRGRSSGMAIGVKNYFNSLDYVPQLNSREEIFEELLKMHHVLKEKYYLLNTSDNEDPFESSRFEALIVNSSGIFKTYELRSVQHFINFSAI